MKNHVYPLLMLFSFSAQAEIISINGKKYEIEIKESLLKCDNFSINSSIKSLPFSIRERYLPYKKLMGHKGNSHLMSQNLTFVTNSSSFDISNIYKNINNYSKIDPKRPYISKPEKCIGSNSVLFYFWGGGNCSTVCEAYALVSFEANGKVKTLKGLEYNEYKKLKSN